jgi:sialate O-acetylesterase
MLSRLKGSMRFPAIAVILLSSLSAFGQVTLSPLFSDHAVLQRNKPIHVWGTAVAGETIQVEFVNRKSSTVADAKGQWKLDLPALPAGGPYDMTVTGSSKVTIHDLLLGEVWLASGQSNMGVTMRSVLHGGSEAAAADHPNLRTFNVIQKASPDPTLTLTGQWIVSTPQTVGSFTAVGYFFGLNLLNDLKVPIGIIHDSVGGTPAEAWTPYPLLTSYPIFASKAKETRDALIQFPTAVAQLKQDIHAWETKYEAADIANTGFKLGYAAPVLTPLNSTTEWKTITLPTTGTALGLQGAVAIWIRREITLPEGEYRLPLRLELNVMRELNTAYFNGVEVGSTPMEPVPYRPTTSVYIVPAALLHAGKNTIAVRIFSHQPARLELGNPLSAIKVPTGGEADNVYLLPLTGEWSYKVEYSHPVPTEAFKSFPAIPTVVPTQTASSLYNGMIYPLQNLSLRGAIWYQGENNAGHSSEYAALLTHLIQGWRTQWQEDFPFYLVQLPNYSGGKWVNWASFRAAQAEVTASVPKTALAVAIDVGESDNIHPRNKRPVGDRLALLARHRTYGEAINDSGPFYQSFTVEGHRVRVRFTQANGLHATGAVLPNFTLAGKDKKFVPATATLDGDSILLSSPDVIEPIAARYAWTNDPVGCNVYNGDNLPLAPFRTDNWTDAPRVP